MLFGEVKKALDQHFLSRSWNWGFAAVMDDCRIGKKPNLESDLLDPVAEIYILTVHEYPLVKSTNLLEYLPPNP